jgi:hypothetical protein
MAGLVPAIHVLASPTKEDVDVRDKPGHDDRKCQASLFTEFEDEEDDVGVLFLVTGTE